MKQQNKQASYTDKHVYVCRSTHGPQSWGGEANWTDWIFLIETDKSIFCFKL